MRYLPSASAIRRARRSLSAALVLGLLTLVPITGAGAQSEEDLIMQEVGNGLSPIGEQRGCEASEGGQARAFRGELGMLCIERWPPVSEATVAALVAAFRESAGVSFSVEGIEPSLGQILDIETPNPIYNVEMGVDGVLYSIRFVQSVEDANFDPQAFVVDLAEQLVSLVPERTTSTTSQGQESAPPPAAADVECDDVCRELLDLLVDVEGWERLGEPTLDLHLGAGLDQVGEVAEAFRSGTRSIFHAYQTDEGVPAGVLISRMRFPLFAAAAVGDLAGRDVDQTMTLDPTHTRPDLWTGRVGADAPVVVFRQGRHSYLITMGSSGPSVADDDIGRLASGLYDAGPGGETEAFFFASVMQAVVQSALLVLVIGILLVGLRAIGGRRAIAVRRYMNSSSLVDADPWARRIRSRSRLLVIAQLMAISALIVGPAVFDLGAAMVISALALSFGLGAGLVVRRLDRPSGAGRFLLPNSKGLVVGVVAAALVLIGLAALVRGIGTWLFTPWFAHLELSDALAIAPQPLSQLMVLGGLVLTVAGALTSRFARRVGKASAQRLVQADGRPPILYLRSFEDDLLPIPTAATSRRPFFEAFSVLGREPFEETVAWQLEQYGPVIGVMPPGSDRATLGSAKEGMPQAEWQPLILSRMAQASMIVLVISDTAGLVWEMEQILRNRFSTKTLFVLPPVDEVQNRERWASFRQIAIAAGVEIDRAIDPASSLVVALTGEMQVGFTAARRDEAAYRAALDGAVSAVNRYRPKTPVGG